MQNKRQYLYICMTLLIGAILIMKLPSNEGESSQAFFLAQPISWNSRDEVITISEARLDKNVFNITLNGNGGKIPDISDFTVIDSDGDAIKLSAGRISSADIGWEAYLTFAGEQSITKPKVTLKKGSDRIAIAMQ